MYLWKCWRDTRVTVFVSFGVILLIFVPILAGTILAVIHGHPPKHPAELLIVGSVISTGLLWLVGWILAKDNPGADIGRDSGDFLLTRPVPRGRLVWTGWAVGMSETIILWIVLSGIFFGVMLLALRVLGVEVSGTWFHNFVPALQPSLWFAIFILNLGFIYGLAYCIGTIARSASWALIGSGIAFFGYGILKSVFHAVWGIHLPDFFLNFHNQNDVPSTLAFVIHACLLVAFPAVAHFVLERMDT